MKIFPPVFPQIYPVASHTDNVGPGSVFVAISGQKSKGILYLVITINP